MHKMGGAWWLTSVIPAALKAEVEGSRSEANLGKSMKSYLKSKLKGKGLRHGLSGRVLA
jgi:hypothetical protein